MRNQTLFQSCRCGMIADEDGNIAVFHDSDSDIDVEWVEYRSNNIHLMDNEGNTVPLGIYLVHKIISNISNGQQISLINVKNKQLRSSITVPFIVQNY